MAHVEVEEMETASNRKHPVSLRLDRDVVALLRVRAEERELGDGRGDGQCVAAQEVLEDSRAAARWAELLERRGR